MEGSESRGPNPPRSKELTSPWSRPRPFTCLMFPWLGLGAYLPPPFPSRAPPTGRFPPLLQQPTSNRPQGATAQAHATRRGRRSLVFCGAEKCRHRPLPLRRRRNPALGAAGVLRGCLFPSLKKKWGGPDTECTYFRHSLREGPLQKAEAGADWLDRESRPIARQEHKLERANKREE